MRTSLAPFFLVALVPALSAAQPAATADRAAAPEAKALVSGPKEGKGPGLDAKAADAINASASAGGMLTTGNTKTQALTLNGVFDMRRGMNGFGAALLGNYGVSKLPGATESQTTAENFQARLRYDRYLTERFALFLMLTERYDRFQGLASRTNIDPGAKYIFWLPENSAFWGELGYDFQHDIRTEGGRNKHDADGKLVSDAPQDRSAKTLDDHSARAFLGFRHAFNKEVTFSTGLEYLQSFVKTDLATANSRVNFDASIAAKLYGGLALGVGFTARFDRSPLENRSKLDTATTLSVIYAFSNKADEEEAKCPACPEIPPCPNAAPAPADPTIPSGQTPPGIAPSGTTPEGTTAPTTTTPPPSGTAPATGADNSLR